MARDQVVIQIPLTCGEWIQGPYLAKEALISLPIDRYTEVEACYAGSDNSTVHPGSLTLQPKAAAGFRSAIRHLGLTEQEAGAVQIRVQSPAPAGKGYATSTSDLCGVMAAVFELFEAPQPPEVLASLCAAIEPTDGLMFRDLTLFDHLSGRVLKRYPPVAGVKLLVLEPRDVCLTENFRNHAGVQEALARKTEAPYFQFEKASREGDLYGLFAAATASLLEHQAALSKPFLEEIVQLSVQAGAYGVAGAHSGTILGIGVPEDLNVQSLIQRLKALGALDWYQKHFVVRTAAGGYRVLQPRSDHDKHKGEQYVYRCYQGDPPGHR